MANTVVTAFMSLPNPVPGVDPGPDYANNIYSSFVIVDQHDHSPGSGQAITPNGLNINADLAFQGNNATLLRSVRFLPQGAPLTGATPDLGCLYEAGVDLYYNDGNGNQVRITQSGSVAGASGTITGLPSGTASASYVSASGTFVFQQATNTAANLDIATVIIRYPGSYPTPAGNFIALEAPVSLSTGYAFTLPNNTPLVNQSAIVSDTSGNLSYMNPDDIGVAMTSIGANPIANARTRTTGTTVAVGGVAVSPSCGAFNTSSASFVDVTNLSVTITTSGRPVYLGLISDGSGIDTEMFTAGNSMRTTIVRDATDLNLYLTQNGTVSIPPGGIWHIDVGVNGAPGTYTYKVQIFKSGGAGMVGINRSFLLAYEI